MRRPAAYKRAGFFFTVEFKPVPHNLATVTAPVFLVSENILRPLGRKALSSFLS